MSIAALRSGKLETRGSVLRGPTPCDELQIAPSCFFLGINSKLLMTQRS
jgi:hypothetical protein